MPKLVVVVNDLYVEKEVDWLIEDDDYILHFDKTGDGEYTAHCMYHTQIVNIPVDTPPDQVPFSIISQL